MKPILSAFSEVLDLNRRWKPDWYSWLSQLAESQSSGGSLGFSPPADPFSPGTPGSMQLDVLNGTLWICMESGKWQSFDGSFSSVSQANQPIRICVADLPWRALVIPNGIPWLPADDWLPALNAASQYILDHGQLGTIVLPPGTIAINGTWKVGDTAGTGSGTGTAVTIHIEGSGGSAINYQGGFNNPGIWIAKNKRFRLQNFSLIQGDDSGANNTGLVLGGSVNGDGSTDCTGGVVSQVNVSGFQTQVSDLNGAASEIVFINCFWSMATSSFGRGLSTRGTGFDLPNSTNHTYLGCVWNNLDIGLDTSQSSMISVYGGNTGTNSKDFNVIQRCRLGIDGVRNDGFGNCTTGRFISLANGAEVTARNCRVNLANGGDNISISGAPGAFALHDSTINGFISLDLTNTHSLVFINNYVWVTSGHFPFSIAASPAGSTHVVSKGNDYTSGDIYDFSPNRLPLIDYEGRWWQDAFSTLYFDPTDYVQKAGSNDSFAGGYVDPNGLEWKALSRVRQLSEASIADPVNFITGKNLRIQGKFNTSNSLAITFSRTISVTAPGSSSLAQGGAFFPADVGKQVFISGGGNPSGDFHGAVIALSHANAWAQVQGAQGQQPNPNFAGSKNAVFGADEPDANYMVLVTGNANETFWVDTITTTGFTVHSSNATSTATVTCLIIR